MSNNICGENAQKKKLTPHKDRAYCSGDETGDRSENGSDTRPHAPVKPFAGEMLSPRVWTVCAAVRDETSTIAPSCQARVGWFNQKDGATLDSSDQIASCSGFHGASSDTILQFLCSNWFFRVC